MLDVGNLKIMMAVSIYKSSLEIDVMNEESSRVYYAKNMFIFLNVRLKQW